MQYEQMSDERLIELYRKGNDQFAATELYKRYEGKLERMAEAAYRSSPKIDKTLFLSRLYDKFISAVKTFDTSKGVQFAWWISVKTYRADYEVVRETQYRQLKDSGGTKYVLREDTPVSLDGILEKTGASIDDIFAIANPDDNGVSDEFKYIADHGGENDLKVAMMRFNGFTYSEIATELGVIGADAKLRMAGQRAVKRVQRLLTDFYNMIEMPERLNGYAL